MVIVFLLIIVLVMRVELEQIVKTHFVSELFQQAPQFVPLMVLVMHQILVLVQIIGQVQTVPFLIAMEHLEILQQHVQVTVPVQL